MSQNILVTGGVGFIGGHLCRRLVEIGHRVRVLDLRQPRDPIAGVEYRVGDIRDSAALGSAMLAQEAVFHLAACVSVPLCEGAPEETARTNLQGTIQVLDAIRKEGNRNFGLFPRMIFASSASVYGSLGEGGQPIEEDGQAFHPISFYGAHKLGAEEQARLYSRAFGIPALSFRFFNVYGPGQDPSSPYSGVISLFADRVLKGEPFRILGDGKQTRDFFSVHDLVRALLQAIEIPAERCQGQSVNLASGVAISVLELAQAFARVKGRDPVLEFAPARSGDIQHSLASIQKAKELLDWSPTVELDPGLRELLV